jgi:hypothetical protein
VENKEGDGLEREGSLNTGKISGSNTLSTRSFTYFVLSHRGGSGKEEFTYLHLQVQRLSPTDRL